MGLTLGLRDKRKILFERDSLFFFVRLYIKNMKFLHFKILHRNIWSLSSKSPEGLNSDFPKPQCQVTPAKASCTECRIGEITIQWDQGLFLSALLLAGWLEGAHFFIETHWDTWPWPWPAKSVFMGHRSSDRSESDKAGQIVTSARNTKSDVEDKADTEGFNPSSLAVEPPSIYIFKCVKWRF